MEMLSEEEITIIENAVEQYYKTGKITQTCQHCGETLTIDVDEYGFTVLCPNGCIESLYKVL